MKKIFSTLLKLTFVLLIFAVLSFMYMSYIDTKNLFCLGKPVDRDGNGVPENCFVTE